MKRAMLVPLLLFVSACVANSSAPASTPVSTSASPKNVLEQYREKLEAERASAVQRLGTKPPPFPGEPPSTGAPEPGLTIAASRGARIYWVPGDRGVTGLWVPLTKGQGSSIFSWSFNSLFRHMHMTQREAAERVYWDAVVYPWIEDLTFFRNGCAVVAEGTSFKTLIVHAQHSSPELLQPMQGVSLPSAPASAVQESRAATAKQSHAPLAAYLRNIALKRCQENTSGCKMLWLTCASDTQSQPVQFSDWEF